jgi:hypothetical protein
MISYAVRNLLSYSERWIIIFFWSIASFLLKGPCIWIMLILSGPIHTLTIVLMVYDSLFEYFTCSFCHFCCWLTWRFYNNLYMDNLTIRIIYSKIVLCVCSIGFCIGSFISTKLRPRCQHILFSRTYRRSACHCIKLERRDLTLALRSRNLLTHRGDCYNAWGIIKLKVHYALCHCDWTSSSTLFLWAISIWSFKKYFISISCGVLLGRVYSGSDLFLSFVLLMFSVQKKLCLFASSVAAQLCILCSRVSGSEEPHDKQFTMFNNLLF